MFTKFQLPLNSYNLSIIFSVALFFAHHHQVLGHPEHKIDSLQHVFTPLREDTHKINTQLVLCQELIQSYQLKEAKELQLAALALSEKSNYLLGLARAYNCAGLIKMKSNEAISAQADYEAALQLSMQAGNKREEGLTQLNTGDMLRFLGNLSGALDRFTLAKDIFQALDDKQLLLRCSYSMCDVMMVQGNPSEAITILLDNLERSKEIRDEKSQAWTCFYLGNAYNRIGEFEKSLSNYSKAIELSDHLRMKDVKARSQTGTGMVYYYQNEYAKALDQFELALKLNEELNSKAGIAQNYSWIGNTNYDLGNYSIALEKQLNALSINEQIGNRMAMGANYSNIANVYVVQGRYEEARKYQLKSLEIHKETGNKNGQANNHFNLTVINVYLLDHQGSLDHAIGALAIYEEIGDKPSVLWCHRLIGDTYSRLCDPEKSKESYNLCLSMSREMNDKLNTARCLLGLGSVYKDLGDYDQARENLEASIPLLKELGTKDPLCNAYKVLSNVEQQAGNYKDAFEAHKLYTEVKDSLISEAHNLQSAELEAEYETEKKDREIQRLNTEKEIDQLQLKLQQDNLLLAQAEKEKLYTLNQYNLQQVKLLDHEKQLQQLVIEKNQSENLIQQSQIDNTKKQLALLNKEKEIQNLEIRKQRSLKNYFLTGVILFAVLSFFAYNYYITHQKLKLQLLRNKIASDLHDEVGSTLSSIYIFSEVAQQQSKEVIPLLNTIGENSRKMLDAMADIVWTINPENDQFEKILLKMRGFAYELLGAKKIEFKFTADDHIAAIRLPMEVRKNLYLIFKEAANNMAKYSGADKASFSLTEKKGLLTMMIRDNGKGFDPNHHTEGNGIKNMKKRASEIGANLLIDSIPGSGTTIELKIAV